MESVFLAQKERSFDDAFSFLSITCLNCNMGFSSSNHFSRHLARMMLKNFLKVSSISHYTYISSIRQGTFNGCYLWFCCWAANVSVRPFGRITAPVQVFLLVLIAQDTFPSSSTFPEMDTVWPLPCHFQLTQRQLANLMYNLIHRSF